MSANSPISASAGAVLDDANAQPPRQPYKPVFHQLVARCQAAASPKKFCFKKQLVSPDATVIDLCAEMFTWAAFRRTKGQRSCTSRKPPEGLVG